LSTADRSDVEVWGGLECTLNRVGDRFHNQLELSGHAERIEQDLDAFASLQLSAIRYPVLWEDVEQSRGYYEFESADRAMSHLEGGAMRPIVGLLHHGSGPRWTSLMDPALPGQLAHFAAAVARRYPWVGDYTPINEPLTTARFAGLYGHWYPHARDDRAFVRALIQQATATVLAMRAIREVNPEARLVQTEDLGQAAGTARLKSQVRFENDRRWLSFDLICGRVTPDHPLYWYLTREGGAGRVELEWLVDNPCPPDILGINHYLRSNRWLDHRLDLFDPVTHGGNGFLRYADVAAADTPLATQAPLSSLIEHTWRRYEIPVALTEVHIFGAPEEQVAWWRYALESAQIAAQKGAVVRAITTWSLLGSFDWDTLCTSDHADVFYEPGVFHVRNGIPVETPLAEVIRQTALESEAMLRA
jgi:dTDP-4-dehydrorhamnose reductase